MSATTPTITQPAEPPDAIGLGELLHPVRRRLGTAIGLQAVGAAIAIVPFAAVAELARVLLVAGPVDRSRAWTVEDRVRRAARAAAIDERIGALPRGYDSVVGRDARFSGGEAQRLSIARAILADTPIVVLDEATAHADPESEALIQDALSQLAAGRTVLVVAHRLASVVGVDRIVVLEQGRIVEQGTHGELLAADGRYARMWWLQEQAGLGDPDGRDADGRDAYAGAGAAMEGGR